MNHHYAGMVNNYSSLPVLIIINNHDIDHNELLNFYLSVSSKQPIFPPFPRCCFRCSGEPRWLRDTLKSPKPSGEKRPPWRDRNGRGDGEDYSCCWLIHGSTASIVWYWLTMVDQWLFRTVYSWMTNINDNGMGPYQPAKICMGGWTSQQKLWCSLDVSRSGITFWLTTLIYARQQHASENWLGEHPNKGIQTVQRVRSNPFMFCCRLNLW